MSQTKEHHGIPCSPESLAEWGKAFTDIEESIEYCEKHPCKLKKIIYKNPHFMRIFS